MRTNYLETVVGQVIHKHVKTKFKIICNALGNFYRFVQRMISWPHTFYNFTFAIKSIVAVELENSAVLLLRLCAINLNLIILLRIC